MLSGGWLYSVLILLTIWFALLCRTAWKLLRGRQADGNRTTRTLFTVGGIGFAAVAVGALLFLHFTWISPSVSQRLGTPTVEILASLLFWATLAGFLLSAVGSGRTRLLGIGTCLITGFWWFTLSLGAAISIGSPIGRHPTTFLIPNGYVGWVEVKYDEKDAAPLQRENGIYTCRIPESGVLNTSSSLEAGWAKDEYFYYSENGSAHGLKDTAWGAGGMIWGGKTEWQQMPDGSQPKRIAEYFYVGTEEQYHRAVSANEARPFNEAKRNRTGP